jgi:hypothetical protein
MTATAIQDDDEEKSLAEKAAADLKRAYATLSKRARRLKRLEAEETLLTALIMKKAFEEVLKYAPDPIREAALKTLATTVATQGFEVRGGDKEKTRRRLAAAAVKEFLSPAGFPSVVIAPKDAKREWVAAGRGSGDLQVGTHYERVEAKAKADAEAKAAAEKADQPEPTPAPAPASSFKPTATDDAAKAAPVDTAATVRAAG